LAINLLSVGGRIAIVTYSDHEGGLQESRAVDLFVAELDPSEFRCFKISQVNIVSCPELLIIHKRIHKKN